MRTTYTLTETEAKLYDAMRAFFDKLDIPNEDFACDLHNSVFCRKYSGCDECPVKAVAFKIDAVNADPETI